jgi:succinate dehydrogenase/fumarate reductase flavoprotein subunit
MGGSSGGGVVQKEEAPVQPTVPVQDYAAFSPGQQGLLAQQMQRGFGGSLLDQQNAMSFYQDTQIPQIRQPSEIEIYLQQLEDAKNPKKLGSKEVVKDPIEQFIRDEDTGSGGYNR